MHIDFVRVWQTFFKHTFYARHESELSGLESQEWLSTILFFFSPGSM